MRSSGEASRTICGSRRGWASRACSLEPRRKPGKEGTNHRAIAPMLEPGLVYLQVIPSPFGQSCDELALETCKAEHTASLLTN